MDASKRWMNHRQRVMCWLAEENISRQEISLELNLKEAFKKHLVESGHWYRILEEGAHDACTPGSRIGEVLTCDPPLQLRPSVLLPISAVFICPSSTPLRWHPSSAPVRGHDPLIPPRTGLLTVWTRCFHFTPPSVYHSVYLYILLLHLSAHLLPAICLSVEVMILRLISALWTWSSGHRLRTRALTHIPEALAAHHTPACCLTIAGNWGAERLMKVKFNTAALIPLARGFIKNYQGNLESAT